MTSQRTCAVMLVGLCAASGGCGQRAETPDKETPSLNLTSWTEISELYMEHPPLVSGHSARFAVHLTMLRDFKPLNAGKPSVTFTPEHGGAPIVFAGTSPLRPGAFRVEGVPPAAGRYHWVLDVNAPGLSDRHDLGLVTIYGDEATAIAQAQTERHDDPAAVSYLKEQQWTNEFATAPVRDADLRSSTRVPASIEPITGGEAVLAAPAAGRFTAPALLPIGTTVSRGQVLGRLEPRLATTEDRATLAADVAQAQAGVDAARADLTRAERLLAERAVPARRIEEARRALTTTEARLQAAQARLQQRDETLRSGGGAASGNAFALRAPIAGRIAAVMATLGASYEEGAPLFRIVRTDRLEVHAQVPAADAPTVRNVTDIALEIPGRADAVTVRADQMHDPGVIDERTGALPLQFQIQNPGGELLLGQHAIAVLYRRDRVRMSAVPRSAVLTEAGRPYVWVQVGGEQFARRFIDITARDGDWVGVRGPLKTGDRVVIRGAYEVQLASAAKGLPAEGHVH